MGLWAPRRARRSGFVRLGLRSVGHINQFPVHRHRDHAARRVAGCAEAKSDASLSLSCLLPNQSEWPSRRNGRPGREAIRDPRGSSSRVAWFSVRIFRPLARG